MNILRIMLIGGDIMKAVIVEVHDKFAIALNNRGEFIKIKNTGRLNVGYEVEVPTKVINLDFKRVSRIAQAAAAIVVLLGLSLGAYAYNTPYSYVNIDINPSLEITVNIFDRIIDVRGINEDGKGLLTNVSYKNKKLDEGVKTVLNTAVEEGYFNYGPDNALMITISSKSSGEKEEICKNLQEVAKVTLDEDKVEAEVIVKQAPLERVKEAKEMGISPGKLLLMETLVEINPEMGAEEYRDKPVKDVVKAIKDELNKSGKVKIAEEKVVLGDIIEPAKGKNEDKKDKKEDKDKKDKEKDEKKPNPPANDKKKDEKPAPPKPANPPAKDPKKAEPGKKDDKIKEDKNKPGEDFYSSFLKSKDYDNYMDYFGWSSYYNDLLNEYYKNKYEGEKIPLEDTPGTHKAEPDNNGIKKEPGKDPKELDKPNKENKDPKVDKEEPHGPSAPKDPIKDKLKEDDKKPNPVPTKKTAKENNVKPTPTPTPTGKKEIKDNKVPNPGPIEKNNKDLPGNNGKKN